MAITPAQKVSLLESEYPELFQGISNEVAAGRYPPLWGLSAERALEWGYTTLKTQEALLSILYDELATLGCFGEEGRQENYVFQHIQDGDYAVLKGEKKSGISEETIRRFVSTYAVLMWGILVSSGSDSQRNIIRALFLLYGTKSEKIASLVGAKKLPKAVIDAVSDMETAKIIVEAIPSLLKRGPITAANYLEDLANNDITRWDVLSLVATGQFLFDDQSLKDGIISRLYAYIVAKSKKNNTGLNYSEYLVLSSAQTVPHIMGVLIPAGVIHPASENVNILQAFVNQSRDPTILLSENVQWDDYNLAKDDNNLLHNISPHDMLYFMTKHPNIDPSRIISYKSLSEMYKYAISDAKSIAPLIKSRYLNFDSIYELISLISLNQRMIDILLNDDDVMTIIEKHTTTNGALFWPTVLIKGSSISAKAILDVVPMSVQEIMNAIMRVNAAKGYYKFDSKKPQSEQLKNVRQRFNIESIYIALKNSDVDGFVAQNDLLLLVVAAFADSTLPSAKKLLRLILEKQLYLPDDHTYLEESVEKLAERLSVKLSRR